MVLSHLQWYAFISPQLYTSPLTDHQSQRQGGLCRPSQRPVPCHKQPTASNSNSQLPSVAALPAARCVPGMQIYKLIALD